MAQPVGAAEALAGALRATRHNPFLCSLGAWLEGQSKKDRDLFCAALDDVELYSTARLRDAFERVEGGRSFNKDTVQKHRMRVCRCFRERD